MSNDGTGTRIETVNSTSTGIDPVATPSTEPKLGLTTGQGRLLSTLEQLLSIEGTNVKSALDQASDLIVQAISADKTDAFLLDPSTHMLVALGTSNTPMGMKQHQLGLHLLPIANDGPEVAVFEKGGYYHTGHAEEDPTIARGLIKGLGIRSMIVVPLDVNGERRGVLQACSSKPDAFSEDDLSFLAAVAHWVGALAHRAELTERIARDAAEQARQVAAEELVTVLAHDLRNYITPLNGRLQMMLARAQREKRERDVEDTEVCTRAVRRLQALITDLMDVARLDQGIFALSPQPVDLVALVQESVGVMRTGRLGIIMRAPDELRVEADPERIKQAIENLITNAVRHSPKGVPVEVEIRSEKRGDTSATLDTSGTGGKADGAGEEEGTSEWAVVTIKDEGPGIPAELMPRLFTRFSAGRGSTGLGLGLYLARSIAEAHGGTLMVESDPGQGTTFRLSLPIDS